MTQSVHYGETSTISARLPTEVANLLYDEAHEMNVPISRLIQTRIMGNSRNFNSIKPRAASGLSGLSGLSGVQFRPNRAGKWVVSGIAGTGAGFMGYHGAKKLGYSEQFSQGAGAVIGLATLVAVYQII